MLGSSLTFDSTLNTFQVCALKKRYFYRILCQNQALSICPLSSNSSLFFGIHVILSWFNFDFIFSFHPNFGLIWLDKRPDIGFLKTTSTFSPRTIIKLWRTEALLKSHKEHVFKKIYFLTQIIKFFFISIFFDFCQKFHAIPSLKSGHSKLNKCKSRLRSLTFLQVECQWFKKASKAEVYRWSVLGGRSKLISSHTDERETISQ